MSDDVPIPELPASQIWATRGLDSFYSADVRRMAHFVREAAGDVLSIEPVDDLVKKPPFELLALAVRAQNAGLPVDVVASLLVFAVGRGSTLAAGALGQIVGQRLEDLSRIDVGRCGSKEFAAHSPTGGAAAQRTDADRKIRRVPEGIRIGRRGRSSGQYLGGVPASRCRRLRL
ncbi:MAG TPA: hypothetical protein PKV67_14950 [Hyphomonas sp.]|nr:hypothetical protein [Hyphomonas sp.]